MDSKTRLQLAHPFPDRMAAAFPLVIGGVYGSTARGEDMAGTDLEPWFVVEDGCDGMLAPIDALVAGFREFIAATEIAPHGYHPVEEIAV